MKKAIVVHSGGMDSSLCLVLALNTYRPEEILSLSFNYNQRHSEELKRAKIISNHLKVEHKILDISFMSQITDNALINNNHKIHHSNKQPPNTLVVGRNGLMAQIAAIQAHSLGANEIYMGVMELEEANSGYRDCSRSYMDLVEKLIRLDLNNPKFEIKTPLVFLTKKETMDLGNQNNMLEYLLENTITCYEGIAQTGCMKCPACKLRNQGLKIFLLENPDFKLDFKTEILNLVV